MDLSSLDRKNIWHPFTPLEGADDPLLIKSASGVYLQTEDGRKIIDAVSSWWVNLHGHAHPVIADAIAKQALELQHVIFAGFTHEPAIRLAENLLHILPVNQEKVFFSDDGSTAVEVALKMAMQYWFNRNKEKKNIIALEGAYHGDTFGSMSIASRGLFTRPFEPFLFETMFIDFPDPENEENVMARFAALIEKYQPGVFIFEPLVQGAAGMRIYRAEILDRMIGFAHEHGIVAIADEVFTGFGRTGRLFACDHLVNKPDIIALSKGITGGALPLGVTTCSGKIAAAFRNADFTKTFFHGHSYTANPLACAAANASIEILSGVDCQASIRRISSRQAEFATRLKGHRNVRRANSLGTILSIELETAEGTAYTNTARTEIYRFFLDRNILLRPLGNVIYVLPPYVITDNELGQVHSAILEFLSLR